MHQTTSRGRHAETFRINEYLWRVTADDGFVYGHVERIPTPNGDRFEAKRYRTTSSRFVSLGAFWAFEDALDCVRFN